MAEKMSAAQRAAVEDVALELASFDPQEVPAILRAVAEKFGVSLEPDSSFSVGGQDA